MSDRGDGIARIAHVTGLPLTPERIDALVDVFETWMAGSNELCRKMSEAQHLAVTPITVLTHPTSPKGE
jgi:hypothetical protein